jgi:hypothetical protein
MPPSLHRGAGAGTGRRRSALTRTKELQASPALAEGCKFLQYAVVARLAARIDDAAPFGLLPRLFLTVNCKWIAQTDFLGLQSLANLIVERA